MAKPKSHLLIPILLLVILQMAEAKTPPGIAKNPSHATCKIKKYKHCYNLEHVCPKFCPDQCTVECASCKPICVGGSNPPPSDSTPYPSTSPSLPTPPTTPKPSPSSPTPSTPSPTPYTPSPSTPPSTTPTTPYPPTPSTPSPTPPSTTPASPSTTTTPSPKPPSPTPSTPSPTPPSTTPTPPSPTTPSSSTPSPTTPSPKPPSTTPSSPSPSTPSPTPSPTPPTPSSPTPPTYPSPSPPTSSPPPDQSASAGARRARCRNRNYPQCYNTEHVCPSSCPGGCEVDCVTCKPVCKCDQPGAVCQDPRFIGGDGITFYFHGKKDHDFCLLSDPNLHINAHFIGKRNPSMKRDFTWVQSIGILFGNHKLFLGALKTAVWDDSADRLAIAFDGEPISLPESEGASWQSERVPTVSLTRVSDTNSIIVEVEGSFRITAKVVPITKEDSRIHNYGITDEDSFAHLDLRFKFFSSSDQVSGVLGQTYRPDYASRVNVGVKMPVMGGYREFKTSSLFAFDCAVSRFKGGVGDKDGDSLEGDLELPSLSCSSGLDGQGVFCKK